MKAIKLFFTLTVLLFTLQTATAQIDRNATSQTTQGTAPTGDVDCSAVYTSYWEFVLAADWDSKDQLAIAYRQAEKQIIMPNATTCFNDDDCNQAREILANYLDKQSWNTRAEFIEIAENAFETFGKKYPKCIGESGSDAMENVTRQR